MMVNRSRRVRPVTVLVGRSHLPRNDALSLIVGLLFDGGTFSDLCGCHIQALATLLLICNVDRWVPLPLGHCQCSGPI